MTESLILCIDQCMLFRITLPNNEIKRNAGEWAQSDFLSSGKLMIFRDISGFFIKIIDDNSNELCRVNSLKQNVEPVNDSSRYFILHITEANTHRNAIVGLGFTDRQSAFDFTASLQEIERRNDHRERNQNEGNDNVNDYILRNNEMITLPYELQMSNDETFGELPQFDESNVPSVFFNEQHVQEMNVDVESLKKEFELEIYRLEEEEYKRKMDEYQKKNEMKHQFGNDSDSDDEENVPKKPQSLIDIQNVNSSVNQNVNNSNNANNNSKQNDLSTFDMFANLNNVSNTSNASGNMMNNNNYNQKSNMNEKKVDDSTFDLFANSDKILPSTNTQNQSSNTMNFDIFGMNANNQNQNNNQPFASSSKNTFDSLLF